MRLSVLNFIGHSIICFHMLFIFIFDTNLMRESLKIMDKLNIYYIYFPVFLISILLFYRFYNIYISVKSSMLHATNKFSQAAFWFICAKSI